MILTKINKLVSLFSKSKFKDPIVKKFIPTPKRPALDVEDPEEKYAVPVQPTVFKYLTPGIAFIT